MFVSEETGSYSLYAVYACQVEERFQLCSLYYLSV